MTSLRQLAGELTTEIVMVSEVIAGLLAGHRGYRAIQALPGTGPVLAAVMVAETGGVSRFKTAGQLASWAGLTPRHREPGIKVIRGHVTTQGSRQLRWALIEAVQHQPAGSRPRRTRGAILARRGRQARNIAKAAAARELPAPVFDGLRDGQARAVTAAPSARPPAGDPVRAA